MMTVFKGVDRVGDYYRAVEQVEGGVISPGGGAALLRITRQGVMDLASRSPDIRAWSYYRGFSLRADYLEISVRDLVRYGVRTGRIGSVEDCGISFPSLAGEIELALAERDLPQASKAR